MIVPVYSDDCCLESGTKIAMTIQLGPRSDYGIIEKIRY